MSEQPLTAPPAPTRLVVTFSSTGDSSLAVHFALQQTQSTAEITGASHDRQKDIIFNFARRAVDEVYQNLNLCHNLGKPRWEEMQEASQTVHLGNATDIRRVIEEICWTLDALLVEGNTGVITQCTNLPKP